MGEAQSPKGTYIAKDRVNRADHASFFHEGRIKEEQLGSINGDK